jgi:hypothetical protein
MQPRSSGSSSFTLSSSSVNLPGSDASGGKARQSTYWQSVARIGIQVAGALEYAHKQGTQHRDIKPSNLLLDTHGTVWVADFGLARTDNDEQLTQTGDIVGTLRYLPPEAFEGRTDARSDLYSLGLTLYELLALRPAFEDRDRHRLIRQLTTEEPPRLDKLNRAIPRDLVTIVHKAIDRERARRYRLDTLPCDRPGPCLRTLDAITGKLLQRRNLSSLNINLHWGDNRASFSLRSPAFAISPKGGLVAGPRRDEPNVLSVCDRATGHEVAVLRGHHGPIQVAAFSRDGNRIDTASSSPSEIKAWDTATGEEVVRLGQPAEGPPFVARSLAFSPDGQRLAAGPRSSSAAGIRIWEVASGRQLAVFQPQVTSVSCLCFSTDGKKLAAAVPATEARVLDAQTGELLFAAPKPYALEGGAFSPDGRRLAGAGRHGEVYLWDAGTGQEVLTLPRLAEPPPGNYGFVARVAFSPDGRRLAANNWDGTISLWSAEDLTPAGRAARLKRAGGRDSGLRLAHRNP